MKTRLKAEYFEASLLRVYADADRVFARLFLMQWAAATVLALHLTPRGWTAGVGKLHPHLWLAVLGGGVLNILPWHLIRVRPAWWLTRHTVAVVQMLWTAVLIHITGGRIETHFHVFVSLAFIAFYRDWRLLTTATLVVAADHLIRGSVWPESVYGIANPEWWRFLEHAAWVVFEDAVLAFSCLRQVQEMKVAAEREAALQVTKADIEHQVRDRTAELSEANNSLAQEMKTRLQMEAELRQAQKLESVGRLASGVAHEINTPIQFVSDSVHFLRDATNDLLGTVEKLQVVHHAVLQGSPTPEAILEATAAEEAADLPYLVENMPKAFARALEGLARVTAIVRSMKEFAHPDNKEMTTIDLNQAIQSTLIIARNEYKFVAEVETDFGDLPRVNCFAGEINQVVLNIIVNAAHAIGDVVKGTDQRGRIVVKTRAGTRAVSITISDTGSGIPESIRDRIFDPFFTTKEVGKGTGQGLAIARAVVQRHHGELTLESEVGKGTTFSILLPVDGLGQTAELAAAVV